MRTVYEAAGGSAGLLRLAQAWHERATSDDVVAHAFSHGYRDDHVERIAAYWGEALGGPPTYTERYGGESDVERMHAGNGEHPEMDRAAIAAFDAALADAGLTEPPLHGVLHDFFAWPDSCQISAHFWSP